MKSYLNVSIAGFTINWSSSLVTGISDSAASLLPTRGGLRPLKWDTQYIWYQTSSMNWCNLDQLNFFNWVPKIGQLQTNSDTSARHMLTCGFWSGLRKLVPPLTDSTHKERAHKSRNMWLARLRRGILGKSPGLVLFYDNNLNDCT